MTRAQGAAEPSASISSILHLYEAGAQARAITLAFRVAERTRLSAMPAAINAVPGLADAWKCGQGFAEEERAFSRGYLAPLASEVPLEYIDVPNLSQKFRNGQAARRHIRNPRIQDRLMQAKR